MNAYIERFVETIEQECLDRFILFDQEHFDHVVSKYLEYCHHERPHQGLGNVLPVTTSSSSSPSEGVVVCRERLGGVLRHYHREVA